MLLEIQFNKQNTPPNKGYFVSLLMYERCGGVEKNNRPTVYISFLPPSTFYSPLSPFLLISTA